MKESVEAVGHLMSTALMLGVSLMSVKPQKGLWNWESHTGCSCAD